MSFLQRYETAAGRNTVETLDPEVGDCESPLQKVPLKFNLLKKVPAHGGHEDENSKLSPVQCFVKIYY